MSKKILIYGIGTFFSKILVFLMVPIYTRLLPAADYGYYDVIVADLQMLISISFIEIWSGIIRYMISDKEKFMVIKAFIKISPVMLLGYTIMYMLLGNWLIMKYPTVIYIYGLSYLLFNVGNTICRGLDKNYDYVISGLLYTIISCALSIVFIVILYQNVKYILISQIIGYIVAALYVEMRTRAYRSAISLDAKKLYVKDLLLYCIPLMLNSFSFLFLGTYNKNIIMKHLGESVSGQYAYVSKFSAILSILISIYSLAWQEEAFLNSENPEKAKVYSYYINMFISFVGLAVPLYIVIAYFFSPLIGGSTYVATVVLIPFVILSAYISEVSGIFSTMIAVNKKTIQIFASTVIGAIVNVILVHFLIVPLGANGASIALCVGFFVAATIRFIFSRKFFGIQINIRIFLITIIEIVALFFLIMKGNQFTLSILACIMFCIWVIFNRSNIREIYSKVLKIVERKK